jgi:hypothetical protein
VKIAQVCALPSPLLLVAKSCHSSGTMQCIDGGFNTSRFVNDLDDDEFQE